MSAGAMAAAAVAWGRYGDRARTVAYLGDGFSGRTDSFARAIYAGG